MRRICATLYFCTKGWRPLIINLSPQCRRNRLKDGTPLEETEPLRPRVLSLLYAQSSLRMRLVLSKSILRGQKRFHLGTFFSTCIAGKISVKTLRAYLSIYYLCTAINKVYLRCAAQNVFKMYIILSGALEAWHGVARVGRRTDDRERAMRHLGQSFFMSYTQRK